MKVPNKEARGVDLPRPDNAGELAPAIETGEPLTTISPSPVPEIEDGAKADLHSGRPTKFTPVRNFDGYPDGKTKTTYTADVEAEAPSNYVKHLRSQGHVGDK